MRLEEFARQRINEYVSKVCSWCDPLMVAKRKNYKFPSYAPDGYLQYLGIISEIAVNYRYKVTAAPSDINGLVCSHIYESCLAGSDGGQFPYFLASEGIIDAILNSDLPEYWDLDKVKLPHQGFIVVIPPGLIQAPKGGDLIALAVSHIGSGAGGDFEQTFGSRRGICVMSTTVGGHSYVTSLSNSDFRDPLVRFDWKEDEADKISNVKSPQASAWNITILKIAAQIVMIFNSRYDLIQEESESGKVKIMGRKYPVYRPRIVGPSYIRLTERSAPEGGKSPRRHIRRGHWRNQLFGAGLLKSKLIWIEPCIVSGGESP